MKDSYYDKPCPLDYLSQPFYKGAYRYYPHFTVKRTGVQKLNFSETLQFIKRCNLDLNLDSSCP